MIRKIHIAFCCLVFLSIASCRTYTKRDPADITKSQSRLAEDFAIFRKILETAHPSLYSYKTEKKMTYLFDSVYGTIDHSLTLREFNNKLFFLTNKIGCAHTAILLPDYVIDTLYNRRLFFPLHLILIKNKLLVNSDLVLPHGSELISVNDMPVSSILQELSLYNPIDGIERKTQRVLAAVNFGYQFYLRYGGRAEFPVSYKDTSGVIKSTLIPASTLGELERNKLAAYYVNPEDVPYSLRVVDSLSFAFMRITTLYFETYNGKLAFEEFLKNSFELLRKKSECKNLIIDLRENGGGYLNNCFLLFSYLTKTPFREYKAVSAKVHKLPFPEYLLSSLSPEDIGEVNVSLKEGFIRQDAFRYRYADSLIEIRKPQKNNCLQNIYIITNENVMSAASYFCTLVKNSGTGKIVGTETRGGEHSGSGFKNLEYRLPYSGVRLVFPYAKMIYTNGGTKNGRGLIPDYIVPDTDSSFKKNNDAQLDFIIDSLIIKKARPITNFAGTNQ